MSDTVEWRWVDVGGDQHVVPLDALARALSTGSLPSFTLVWRPGFVDWMHARAVPELALALRLPPPGDKDLPKLDPEARSPPKPAVARYAAFLKGLAPTTLMVAPSQTSKTPPPPPVPSNRPRAPLRPPTPKPGVSVPIPVRDVLPTLADQPPVRSPTLRPSGALPPPPRGVPPQHRADTDSHDDLTADAPTERGTKSIPPPLPLAARTSRPPPSPVPAPFSSPRTEPLIGGLTRRSLAIALAAGLIWPMAAAATLAVARRAAPAPPPSVIRPVAGVLILPTPQCTLEKTAVRLADSAFFAVPIVLADAPGNDDDVAVGFAAKSDRAVGLRIDLASLAATQVFDETVASTTLLGIVPLGRTGTLTFAIDHADAPVASERTVDAAKPFAVGAGTDGFSRAIGQDTELIWPSKAQHPEITTPRVATVPGVGSVVVFRHGGQQGKILIGWLNEDGTRRTELVPSDTTASLVGTPAVAANAKAALVAYAARASAAEPWHVELLTMPVGDLPGHASTFSLPPGGPGGEAIAPAAAGVSGGRFVVQWTEGASGNRTVRAEELSADLVPQGDAITLSGPDQDAGQGALWVRGGRALSLFFVKKDPSPELWGALLRCP
ncbi:MAG TPA: DUF4339 domain-containing protein [Polyangiaceae bacterium]|nr:DUF4339 domain-containing protein [Polyangiaceae bacterium]